MTRQKKGGGAYSAKAAAGSKASQWGAGELLELSLATEPLVPEYW